MAKQKAMGYFYPEDQWWDWVYETAKDDGEKFGFQIRDIKFTGFHSQGDGASWEGFVDVHKWLEHHKPDDPHAQILMELIDNECADRMLEIRPMHGRHYSHAQTMTCGYLGVIAFPVGTTLRKGIFQGAYADDLIDTIGAGYLDIVTIDILRHARDYADEIYKRLRDEYDSLCSEEYIAELCDANDYLFTKDGRFV